MENLEQMAPQTLIFILSMAGAIIVILLAIVGFFLARIVSDVRRVTEETGKNKGRIELVELQQQNDAKNTQKEIREMARSVDKLADGVNTLVISLAKKGIEAESNG